MESASTLLSLVENLVHRIPDIRDRSMKALSRKLLSPLVTDEHFEILSRISGSAHLILQWMNDRYDAAPLDVVNGAFRVILVVITKSEQIRQLFLEAGAVVFFEEFGRHNPAYIRDCERIVQEVLRLGGGRGRSGGSALRPDPPVDVVREDDSASIKVHSQPAQFKLLTELVPSDEQALFDLSVRIKFSTAATPPNVILEMAREIRFGLCMTLHTIIFVERTSLLEALCCQLSCQTPSLSAVEQFEPLALGLIDLLERLHAAADIVVPVQTVLVPLIASSIQSFEHRRRLLVLSRRILRLALKIAHRHADLSTGYLVGSDGWGLTQLEAVIRPLGRVVSGIFSDRCYQTEKFTFADSSVVSVRRTIEWTDEHRLVAELAIDVLNAVAAPDTAVVFGASESLQALLSHVSHWISDDLFYDSSNRVKSKASIAAVCLATLDPESQDDFTRARELLLAVRRQEANEPLSGRDAVNLLHVWRKVPGLLANGGESVSFMKSVVTRCDDREAVVQLVKSELDLGDAFIHLLREGMDMRHLNSERFTAELIAFIQCSNPATLVSLLAGNTSLPLLSSDAVMDTTPISLIRSLLSRSESVRRQAALVLWKTSGDLQASGCMFVPDPLAGCDLAATPLEQYRVGSISVDVDEVVHAISIATSARLGNEIRAASCVQACTLLASSGCLLSVPSQSMESLLAAMDTHTKVDPDVAVGMCHLVALLVTRSAVHPDILAEIVPVVVRKLFSSDESVTAAALLLASRLVFDRTSVLGGLEESCADLHYPILARLGEVSYHLFGLGGDAESPQKREQAPPTNKAFAICVSLSAMNGKSADASYGNRLVDSTQSRPEVAILAGQYLPQPTHDFVKRLVYAIETLPPVIESGAKKVDSLTIEQACSKYVSETLWVAVRIVHCCTGRQACDETVRAISLTVLGTVQTLLKALSVNYFQSACPPWFLCECLSASSTMIAAVWRLDGNVPDVVEQFDWSSVIVNALNYCPSEAMWRCCLRLVVLLCQLDSPVDNFSFVLDAAVARVFSSPAPDNYSAESVLWLSCSCTMDQLRELSSPQESTNLADVALRATLTGSSESRCLGWRLFRRLVFNDTVHGLNPALVEEAWTRAIEVLSQDGGTPSLADSVLVAEICMFVHDCILMDSSSNRTESVMDLLSGDALFSSHDSEVVWAGVVSIIRALAEKRGKEVSQVLIHHDRWKWILESAQSSSAAAVAATLASACLETDPRLLVYLTHSGLFVTLSRIQAGDLHDGVVAICRLVEDSLASSSSPVNHFEPAIQWMSSSGLVAVLAAAVHAKPDCAFDLIEVIAAVLVDNGGCISSGNELLTSILTVQPSPLLGLSGCAALTRLLRVPGLVTSEPDSQPVIDTMRFHDSVLVPDGLRFASPGAALFAAQMRVVSAWTAASCSSPGICQAYADWFCSVWSRAVLITFSKQTSPVPVLSELVCGLLEVLALCDLSLQCWGPPLSQVLSFVTRTDVPFTPQFFSLCLGVAEAAAPALVRKAVTARVVSALISVHATVHGKNVPKDPAALARAGAVIRLAASLVGCRLVGNEVLNSLDGWLEAREALDQDLLVRLVASVVLAGGHCRRAIAANEEAVALLIAMAKQSCMPGTAGLAGQALSTLSATSFKTMQAVAEQAGG